MFSGGGAILRNCTTHIYKLLKKACCESRARRMNEEASLIASDYLAETNSQRDTLVAINQRMEQEIADELKMTVADSKAANQAIELIEDGTGNMMVRLRLCILLTEALGAGAILLVYFLKNPDILNSRTLEGLMYVPGFVVSISGLILDLVSCLGPRNCHSVFNNHEAAANGGYINKAEVQQVGININATDDLNQIRINLETKALENSKTIQTKANNIKQPKFNLLVDNALATVAQMPTVLVALILAYTGTFDLDELFNNKVYGFFDKHYPIFNNRQDNSSISQTILEYAGTFKEYKK